MVGGGLGVAEPGAVTPDVMVSEPQLGHQFVGSEAAVLSGPIRVVLPFLMSPMTSRSIG